MRLVAISDTHLQHRKLAIPYGDVLIHAGDFSNRGDVPDLVEFAQWFVDQPHPYKIFVPGNHDLVCEWQPHMLQEIFHGRSDIRAVIHGPFNIAGLHCFASAYSTEIRPNSPWVFSYPDGKGARYYDGIPAGLDVLITHGPPYGILDEVSYSHPGEDPHVGDPDLLRIISERPPKVHIFGHIHEAAGTYQNAQTRFYNAATCDLMYRPINPPQVIDL